MSELGSVKSRDTTQSVVNEYRWTDSSFGPTELAVEIAAKSPVVVHITNGIFGRNEIDTISASQMVCVVGELQQKRVLAIDRRGRLLTIPADYPIKFQVIGKKRKRGKARLLKSIMNSYNVPISVMFNKKAKWKFKIGYRTFDSQSYGKLDLLQQYNEKYFVCYTIVRGELDSKITLIPSHLPLKMKQAIGLKLGSSLEWDDIQRKRTDICKKLDISAVKGPKDILLVDESRLLDTTENGHSSDSLAHALKKGSPQTGLLTMLAGIFKGGSLSNLSSTTNTLTSSMPDRNAAASGGDPIYSVPLGKSRQLVLQTGGTNQRKALTGDEHVTRVYLGEQSLKAKSGEGRVDGQYATLDEVKPRGVLKHTTRLSSSTGNLYATAGRPKHGIYWGPSSASEYGTVGKAASDIGSGTMKYGTKFISRDGYSSDFGTYGDNRRVPIFSKTGAHGSQHHVSDTEIRRAHTMSLPARGGRRQVAGGSFRSLPRHTYSINLSENGYLSEPDMRPAVEDIYARPKKTRFGRSNTVEDYDERDGALQSGARGHHEGGRKGGGHYEALDEYERRDGRASEAHGRRRLLSMNEWKEGRLLVRINEEDADDRNPLHPVLSSPNVARRSRRYVDPYDEDYYSEEESVTETDSYYDDESQTPYEDDSYIEDSYDRKMYKSRAAKNEVHDTNNNRVSLLSKQNVAGDNWKLKKTTNNTQKVDKKDATYSGTVVIHSAELAPKQLPVKYSQGQETWKTEQHDVFHAGEDLKTPNLPDEGRSKRLTTMDSFGFGQPGEEGWIELEEGQTIYTAPPNDDDMTNDTDHDSERFYGRPRGDAEQPDRRVSRSYNVIKIGSEDDDVKIEEVQEGDSSSSAGIDSEMDRDNNDTHSATTSQSALDQQTEMRKRESQLELATSHLEELDAVLRNSLVEDKGSDIQTPGEDAIIDGPAWPNGSLPRPVDPRDIEDMAISDISPREESQISQPSSQSRGQEEAMSISDTQPEVNANMNNSNEKPARDKQRTNQATVDSRKPTTPVQRSTGSFVMRSSTGLPSREGSLTRTDNAQPSTNTSSVDNWASTAFAPRKGGHSYHQNKIEFTKF